MTALLSIIIHSKLNFENLVCSICNKLSRKIYALGRTANYMSSDKRKILMKTSIESQFNYCPLIWMFHSRNSNNKITPLNERTLRIVYSDYTPSFQGLFNKDNFFSIHERNIQSLAIEIHKFTNS